MSLFRPFHFPSYSGSFSDPFSFAIFDDTDAENTAANGGSKSQAGTDVATTGHGAQGSLAPRHFTDLLHRNPVFAGPRVDIHEEAQRFVVTAELPGVKREDVHISLDEKRRLTLSGEIRSHYDSSSTQQTQEQQGDKTSTDKASADKAAAKDDNKQQQQPVQHPPRPLVSERTYGSFTRSFILPRSIDSNGEVKASFKEGLLKIEIPKLAKPEHKQPRTIAIE